MIRLLYQSIRGGGWYLGGAARLAAHARLRGALSIRYYFVGFRCAKGKRC